MRFLDGSETIQVRAALLSQSLAGRPAVQDEPYLLPQDVLVEQAPERLRIMDHFDHVLPPDSPEQVVHFGLVLGGHLPLNDYVQIEDLYVNAMAALWRQAGQNCVIETSLGLEPASKLRRASKFLSEVQVSRMNRVRDRVRRKSGATFVTDDQDDLELLVRLSTREIIGTCLAFESLGLGLMSHFDTTWIIWTRDDAAHLWLESVTRDTGLHWRYV